MNESQLGDSTLLPDEYRATSKLLSDEDTLRMKQLAVRLSKRKDLIGGRFFRKYEKLQLWKSDLDSLADHDQEALLKIKTAIERGEIWFGSSKDEHGLSRVSALVIYGGNSFIPVREVEIYETLVEIGTDLAKMKGLKSLALMNVGKGELDFTEIGTLPSLTHFEPPLDTSDLDLLGMKNLPQIEWLELLGAFNVKGAFITEIEEESLVQYINFGLSGLTSSNFKELTKLRHLKKVGLTNEVSKGSRLIDIDGLRSKLQDEDIEALLTSPKQLERMKDGNAVVQHPLS